MDDPEHFYAAARQAFELAGIGSIVARAADPEGKVAMHAMRAAPDLVGQRFGLVVSGLFGHPNTAVAPPHGSARAAFQSPCAPARLAEMHLAVDDAGQHMQPRQSIVEPALAA